MYSKPELALNYLKYYLSSSNGKGHGTHSPFIFHFITRILNNKTNYPDYDLVENLRNQLSKDKRSLDIEDLGAGSTITKASKRTIAAIAKNAAKPKKYGQLLFRMVREYSPATIIELGTSLGITTSYLSLAKPDAALVTMEGASSVADIAKENFKNAGLNNIELVKGNFDDTLTEVLNRFSTIDFVFIDGNHRQIPTESYFKKFLTKVNSNTILIFDDIHWSKEMENAWKTIKDHPGVTCTIDLFFIGIVFFRKEFMAKQHFVIRF